MTQDEIDAEIDAHLLRKAFKEWIAIAIAVAVIALVIVLNTL
jgi:hypothetical protein